MDMHPSLPQNLWESTPPEVRAYIGTLETRLSTLELMVEALQEQNRALQEQLNQTSRNSSRPPSRARLLVRDLQRDLLVDPGVFGEVHGAESAAAERRDDLVLPEGLASE